MPKKLSFILSFEGLAIVMILAYCSTTDIIFLIASVLYQIICVIVLTYYIILSHDKSKKDKVEMRINATEELLIVEYDSLILADLLIELFNNGILSEDKFNLLADKSSDNIKRLTKLNLRSENAINDAKDKK